MFNRDYCIDWRYSQSCWYFDPALFVNYCPSTFSLVQLPFPLPCVNKYRSIQCVTGGRGSGCVESIYMSHTLCIWPDSEPTKLLHHPKQKPRRGGGLRQIKTCAKYLYWSIFKKLTLISTPEKNCLPLMSQTPWLGSACCFVLPPYCSLGGGSTRPLTCASNDN